MALSNNPKMSKLNSNLLNSNHLSSNHGTLQSLDRGTVTIDGFSSTEDTIKLFLGLFPEKKDELLEVSKTVKWSMTEIMIRECSFDPAKLSNSWRDFCIDVNEEHEENVDTNSDTSLFEAILKRTYNRKYLSQYEEHTKILENNYKKGLYKKVMELIETRRRDFPPSLDFIKED